MDVIIEWDPEDSSKGYAYGERQCGGTKVTAVARPPAKLDYWTVDGECRLGGRGHYAIMVRPGVTVKAFFE